MCMYMCYATALRICGIAISTANAMAGTVYEPPSTTAMPMDTVMPVVMSAYVMCANVCSVCVMVYSSVMCTCGKPVCVGIAVWSVISIYMNIGGSVSPCAQTYILTDKELRCKKSA